MMERVHLLPLLLTLSVTGVCPKSEIDVRTVHAGEMEVLTDSRSNHSDARRVWTSYTSRGTEEISSMSSAQQRLRALLLHGGHLVILRASRNHEGNYSCSLRTGSQLWFRLVVQTTQSREQKKQSQYSKTCFAEEACSLNCPEVNTPAANIPNITSNGIIWNKEGELSKGYFPCVEENNGGVYTCTRLYLYYGQIYNKTFTVRLIVEPKENLMIPAITSPTDGDVVYVELGSPKVIHCKAVLYSELDGIFWSSEKSFIEKNSSFPVFYNSSRDTKGEETKMIASLVFKSVSKEDTSKNYTCRLESESRSSKVTITLVEKPGVSYVPLALGVVCVMVVMVSTLVLYVSFKITITLFLRDTLGCHSRTSDGKSYDAFLMYYESDADAGLHEEDRKYLERVLEERFGYSLCLYERDVLPGQAEAEAVLECIEQSRTVVLVPTSPDPGPGSGLLIALHEALVERQTRLVFINTDTTEELKCGLLPETLQFLSETGDCVTWKGQSSMQPSSSFWKQLRYYLAAPQYSAKARLLPQTV
ncbi:interleukin-18 receptor 1-like [Centropristis striata]|uniref:interleukin-18 receptor 1-like n=1 Tax=Centropristis striata TaxID=184440 RepID=UPI0027E11FEB|nr:interleukin-18 receptor 1-like [Centropristis striata]